MAGLVARVRVARFLPKSQACGYITGRVRGGGTALLDGGTGGLREGGLIRVADGDIMPPGGAGSSRAPLSVDATPLLPWRGQSQSGAAHEALPP